MMRMAPALLYREAYHLPKVGELASMYISLPVKFALLSFVITLFGVIGVAWMAYLESDDLLEKEAVHNLSLQMNEDVAALENQIRLIRNDMTFLANAQEIKILGSFLTNQPGVADISWMNFRDIESLFKTVLTQRDMYYQIRLIGLAADGRELVRVARIGDQISVIAKNHLQPKGSRGYFKGSLQLKAGQIRFSDVTLDREQGGQISQPARPMLRVSTPVYDSRERLLAIIVISVDMKLFSSVLLGEGTQHNVFLANQHGDYLIHPNDSKAMAFEYGRVSTLQGDYDLAGASEHRSYSFRGENTDEYLFDQRGVVLQLGRVHLDDHHDPHASYLQLGAYTELNQLRAESLGLRNRMLWMTLALALALGLITYLLARRMVRPIQQMIEVAVRLGYGDESVVFPVKSNDEIGRLGNALRQLLFHMASSRKELQRMNVELESKVEQRTSELSKLAATLEAQNSKLEAAVIEARQAGVAKSQFLATMSHEIRTPLNGVLGLTELVLSSELQPMQRESLKSVQYSGQALLTILNDILDYSKIEAGLMEMKPTDTSPNEVIERVAKLFTNKLHKGEAKLELIVRELPLLPNLLLVDAHRLQQVMMNLLSNAVKFTEAGEIMIAADLVSETESAMTVRFQVCDTGPGISAKDQARLFDEFTQADGTDTRKHGGTGLGLSIVKRLVALMGGEIAVRSEPGKGSCFYFELTLAKGVAVEDGPHCYRDEFSGWRILVVNESSRCRQMLVDMFSLWGMQVEAGDCGSDALHMLQEQSFDLILIDQQMDHMDGLSLARVIRQRDTLSALKVILTSSLDVSFDPGLCQQYGLDAFIHKPLYQRQLFETLLTVMGMRTTASASEQPRHFALRHERILLAEDNAVNQQVATGLLAHQGLVNVDVAANGQEAVDMFGRYDYDLILMDVQMPEMDGIAATREIRALEAFGGDVPVPIVALTAHALLDDRAQTFEAGMVDHLTKPLTGKALQEMLEKWLPLPEEVDADVIIGADHIKTEAVVRAQEQVANEAAEDLSVLDEAALRQLREDLGFGIGMILDTYMDELPKQVAAIEAALASEDAEALRRNAHRLKGASSSVMAKPLAELCHQLEIYGRQGDIEAAAGTFNAFRMAVSEVQQAFSAAWLDEVR
ncbi:response regulator [Mariprofundus erugo]|nr:response regulator [Mariprofundus erugo]